MSGGRRLLFVVNADWFFISHRLKLARAFMSEGYDVGLCAGESTFRRELEAEGIRFFPLRIDRGGTHPLRDAATFASLVKAYRAFAPHVVHHVTIKPVLYGSMAARLLRIPTVNAVSGLGYAFIPRAKERWQNTALRAALRSAYRLALSNPGSRVIFQNEDDLGAFVRDGLVASDRARLIRGSGVDLSVYRPSPLPDGDFVALVPSRLLWDKGIQEVVDAARVVRAKHPRARIVLLGRIDEGNPAAVPDAAVAAWVKEGVIEWWQACPHDAMPGVYSRAHVVVLPSYREGLPLALAEAAAAGRAVVTTDVPGCRDTVVHGRSGWLVPARRSEEIAAALLEAIEDRARLVTMGQEARALAEERFDERDVILRTRAIYDELLGAGAC
jgi:glycosyltransferase involved in cell wall biosynthesis